MSDQPALSHAPAPVANAGFGDDWWQRGVVYQVYPRSFADSNGDGVGDLPGLISKLDHLNDGTPASLGIDAIWLSPIHPSPGFDVGYDVADYDAIDPLFGTLDDFDRLVDEAHRRGIRIILDLVMNHTSSAHRWFTESRRDRTGPTGDWYIWRDSPGGKRRGAKPNNWVSFFGGSAWEWDDVRGQYYMHTFLPEQPDLNWRNPAVRAEMLRMTRAWLERGVDGFRLDVFNAFFKHEALLSNPRTRGFARRPYSRQTHLYDKDRPELLDFLTEFRAMVDSFPGRMTVGEMFSADYRAAAALATPRHLAFDFLLISQPWKARAFAWASKEHEQIFPEGRWPTVVLSNHDQSRHVSRLSAGAKDPVADGDAIARAAAVLNLTLRGTPFLYYGEEIAARDVKVPWAEIIDPPAKRGGRLTRALVPWWNRDAARSPMPWGGGGQNGGFSAGRPWIRMANDIDRRNVAAQDHDPGSVLTTYRRLIWLRRQHPELQVGSYREVASGSVDVFAYLREGEGGSALVVINFAANAVMAQVVARADTRWTPVFDTIDPAAPAFADGTSLALRPYEAAIFRPA
jgi:alpha-glucosidase